MSELYGGTVGPIRVVARRVGVFFGGIVFNLFHSANAPLRRKNRRRYGSAS